MSEGENKNVEAKADEEVKSSPVLSLVDSIIEKLQAVYTGDLSPINMVAIVTTAMQLVEKVPKLKGGQKKALVLSVLDKLADKSGIDKSILAFVPDMIDMAIAIQNGVTKIAPAVGKCCF